jgi:hypothetical protein
MLSPSKRILQMYKPLIVKMAEDSTIIATTKSIMNFFVMPKPYPILLLFCLYWKWCKGYPSLHKDAIHSFVILWLLSSFMKQTYKKCIVNLTSCFPPNI